MSSTMRDIAKKAGVSVNTISRALSNRPEISEETKNRILAIAKEMNYLPNETAKALLSGNTKTLGVLISDNVNPFFAKQIRGIEEVARESGYSVFLCNTNEQYTQEIEAITSLRVKRVNGLLITPSLGKYDHIMQLKKDKFPFVLLNRHLDDPEIDCVRNDNQQGAYEGVRCLTQLGHRNILHVTGPQYVSSVYERMRGYQKALEESGVSFNRDLVLNTDLSLEGGYRKVKDSFLKLNPRPTAIFAYSDLLAIGVLKALREMRLKVPEDVALVGYDDIEVASFVESPLTTVAQDAYEIGRMGTQILLDRINWSGDEPWVPKQVILKPELKVRVSSGEKIN